MANGPGWVVIGHSQALQHVVALARQYASIPYPVLLVGPTGVGKGLLARLMHSLSGRVGEFVPVAGGQLVESLFHSQLFGHVKGAYTGADRSAVGAFERARGGTLFLDELPLWSRAAQSAVLRAVDERLMLPVGGERELQLTCRVLFAANRPLDELEAEGLLLQDLRYRIGDFAIEIPPLAARREDIAELAYHFLDEARAGSGDPLPLTFDPSALYRLLEFNWPGNVRQLNAAVAYACVHAAEAERIEIRHLPPYLNAPESARRALDRATRDAMTAWSLERAHGNRRAAARLLGVHPNTIDYRRKQWRLAAVEDVRAMM